MKNLSIVISILCFITMPLYAQNPAIEARRSDFFKEKIQQHMKPVPVGQNVVFVDSVNKQIVVPESEANTTTTIPLKGTLYDVRIDKGLAIIGEVSETPIPTYMREKMDDNSGLVRIYSLKEHRYKYKTDLDVQQLGVLNNHIIFTNAINELTQNGEFEIIYLNTGEIYKPKIGDTKAPFGAAAVDNKNILLLTLISKKYTGKLGPEYVTLGVAVYLFNTENRQAKREAYIANATITGTAQNPGCFQKLGKGKIGFFLDDLHKRFSPSYYIYRNGTVEKQRTFEGGFV